MAPKKSKKVKRTRQESDSEPEADHGPTPAEIEAKLEARRIQIRAWKVAAERGVLLSRTAKYRKYNAVIEAMKWEKFTEQPIKPCLPMVHEFYANLPDSKEGIVNVFGKSVSYNPGAINTALGLDRHQFHHPDPYKDLMSSNSDTTLYEIQHTLTFGKGPLVLYGTGTIDTGTNVTNEAKFWRHFIQGRILGLTSHGNCTTKAQAILFALMLGKRFNVGQFIHDEIDSVRPKLQKTRFGSQSLQYPSLITTLCLNAGVPRPEGAVDRGLLPVLDNSHVAAKDHEVMSTKDFHEMMWGGKGNPEWQVPQYEPGAPAPLARPAVEEEEAQGESSQMNTQAGPEASNIYMQRMDDQDREIAEVKRMQQLMLDESRAFYRDFRYQFNMPSPPPSGHE